MNLHILKKKVFRYIKTIAHLTKGYPTRKLFPLKIRTSLSTKISYNMLYNHSTATEYEKYSKVLENAFSIKVYQCNKARTEIKKAADKDWENLLNKPTEESKQILTITITYNRTLRT